MFEKFLSSTNLDYKPVGTGKFKGKHNVSGDNRVQLLLDRINLICVIYGISLTIPPLQKHLYVCLLI